MAYLYLFGATLCSASLSIMGTLFNKRNQAYKNFSMLYNFILISCACLGWGVLYIANFSFDARVLLYSVGYAAGYAMALISLFKALECGPVSLTSLIKSISMISVSLWGFIFWNASPTVYVLIGLSLVILSLAFCFLQKGGEKRKMPFKWFVYTALLFIGNGGSLIAQKYQQLAFDGAHKNMLMFFATLIASVSCLIFFLTGRKDTVFPKEAVRRTAWIPMCAGFGSTALNLFILLMLPLLSSSIIYPFMAVGAIIITTLFSALICKERLRPLQWVGLLVGCVALVFLNI